MLISVIGTGETEQFCGRLCAQADHVRGIREGADAVVFVLPDYYSRGLWELRRWLGENRDRLRGTLCSCVCLSRTGGGGELALRSIVSELMRAQCLIYLCGVVCADGLIRTGGDPEICPGGMSIEDFCTKLRNMAEHFR